MRDTLEKHEQREIPIPDIERLFIDALQLSQAQQRILRLIGRWAHQKYPEWYSQYSYSELAQNTRAQIMGIVQGPSHVKIDETPQEIESIIFDDAREFMGALTSKEPLHNLYEILDPIIERDCDVLSGRGDHLSKLVGRQSRSKAPQGMPMTPQRDIRNSLFVYFIVMTPEKRARVHGQNYGLHPALEEMCSELRRYYHDLKQKQKPSPEEETLLSDAKRLIDFWNKHHPQAQV